MLRERGVIEDDPRDVFGPRVVSAAEPKFNRDETTGKVWGYGKIWL
jgi:hypothetical protein